MRNGIRVLTVAAVMASASVVIAQQPDSTQPKLPPAVLGAPTVPADVFTPVTTTATPSNNIWVDADYLLWWQKASGSPNLAISGPTLNNTINPVIVSPGVPPNVQYNAVIDGTTTVTHGPKVPTSPGFIGLFSVSTQTHLGSDNAKSVLFANDNGNPLTSGFNFTLGGWLDRDQTFGVEASYLILLKSWATYNSSPSANNFVAVPYQNAATGAQTSYIVNLPGNYTSFSSTYINTTPAVFVHLYDTTNFDIARGSLSIGSTSFLQGGEANAVMNLGRAANWHVEATGGVRVLELDEVLKINSSVAQDNTTTTYYDPALGLPTGNIPVTNEFTGVVKRYDDFETHNTFYGGQVGLRGGYDWGRFSITAGAEVGVGLMHEDISINGTTTIVGQNTFIPTKTIFLAGIPLTVAQNNQVLVNPQGTTTRGGLFAQPGNIGTYSHAAFAVVPEGLLKLNYRFTDRITGSLGYNFMYISTVARPGEQVNPSINPTLLSYPPQATLPAAPTFQYQRADYWAQGMTFGIEYRY